MFLSANAGLTAAVNSVPAVYLNENSSRPVRQVYRIGDFGCVVKFK